MRPMTVTALTRPIVVGEMSFLCGSSLILDQALVIGSHTVAFFGFVFSIIKHQANPKKADSRHFSRYKIIMEHHLKDVFSLAKSSGGQDGRPTVWSIRPQEIFIFG